MATFTYTPDWSANKTHKPRIIEARFGDGYSQRAADGINTNPEVWNLLFKVRSDTDADAIDIFLSARGGHEAFDWTSPTGTVGKFICRDWNYGLDQLNNNVITATFEQVFES